MIDAWTEHHVPSGDLRLRVVRSNGRGPTVVAAHGIVDDGACWRRLATALAPEFDLLMVDARGHGGSDRARSYAFDDHVGDLLAVIDAFDLVEPILLGHSMGGAHLAAVATAPGVQPRAVVLEDPHWPEAAEDPAIYDLEAWRARLDATRRVPRAGIAARGRRDHPRWHADDLLAWAEAQRRVDPDVVTWLRDAAAIAEWPARLAALARPTLVVTGDHEVSVTPALARRATRLSPWISVSRLAGAGHSVRRDRFALYLAVVRRFLRSLPPTTTERVDSTDAQRTAEPDRLI